MRSALLLLGFLTIVALPCAAADEFPIGRWYTENIESDHHYQIVTESRADGTFRKSGRDSTDCENILNWDETGTWAFDADRYTQVTLTVGGEKVDTTQDFYHDSFDFKRNDADHVTLFDPKTGVTWSLERVADNFAIPAPAHCAT